MIVCIYIPYIHSQWLQWEHVPFGSAVTNEYFCKFKPTINHVRVVKASSAALPPALECNNHQQATRSVIGMP